LQAREATQRGDIYGQTQKETKKERKEVKKLFKHYSNRVG
jgi:hypothetical protein